MPMIAPNASLANATPLTTLALVEAKASCGGLSSRQKLNIEHRDYKYLYVSLQTIRIS